jgi:hypothetical protein
MAADARKTGIDMGDLKDLEPLAKRLNAATDSLNEILQTIQDRLNTLAIGVEVWLGKALEESDWRDIVDRDQEPIPGCREYTAEELGYGRIGDGWALLVRTRRYVQDPDDHSVAAREVFDDGYGEKPLLHASRKLRLAAVPLIPRLIDEIKAEAERSIAAVEQAKKIADSLK